MYLEIDGKHAEQNPENLLFTKYSTRVVVMWSSTWSTYINTSRSTYINTSSNKMYLAVSLARQRLQSVCSDGASENTPSANNLTVCVTRHSWVPIRLSPWFAAQSRSGSQKDEICINTFSFRVGCFSLRNPKTTTLYDQLEDFVDNEDQKTKIKLVEILGLQFNFYINYELQIATVIWFVGIYLSVVIFFSFSFHISKCNHYLSTRVFLPWEKLQDFGIHL